ncbi:hypothetical protein MTO96_018587 [Rhipicephalus appendiculatus]
MRSEGLCILILLSFCDGWIQSPNVHYCFDQETLYVANVVVVNATVNMVMSVNYSIEFTRRLTTNPHVEIVMSVADGPHVPCIDNIGSCVYDLCSARNYIEAQIGSPWGNDCPVPQGLFTGHFRYQLSNTTWDTLKGRAVIIRANVMEHGDLFGCVRVAVMVRPTI